MTRTLALCFTLTCLFLAGCDASFVDQEGYLAGQVPSNAVIVDGSSRGGRCDDGRSPAEATSAKTPWCTLDHALAATPLGDTVRVRGGSYPTWHADASLGRSEDLLFAPYPQEQVTVAGLDFKGQTHVEVDDFAFTRTLVLEDGNAHLTFKGCDVTAPKGSSGLFLTAPVDTLSLLSCHFHDLAQNDDPSSGRAVHAEPGGSNFQVSSCRFDDVAGTALRLFDVDGLTVTDNEFTTDAEPVIILGSSGVTFARNRFFQGDAPVQLRTSTAVRMENNLFSGFSNWALQLGSLPGAVVVNNTAWGNGKGGLDFEEAGAPHTTSLTLQNNVLQTLEGNLQSAMLALEDYNLLGDSGGSGSHDVHAVPSFVDPASRDFHLASGSAGVDAANANGAPAMDALGRARLDDLGVPNTGAGSPPYGDLGAFERQP